MNRTYITRAIVGTALGVWIGAALLAVWMRQVPAPAAPADAPTAPLPATRDAGGDARERVGPGAEQLAGRVLDAAGAGIAGAEVRARPDAAADAPPVSVTVTRPDGGFVLRGLEPGVFRLEVQGEGVLPTHVRFVAVPGDSLRIVAARRVAVSGRVTDAGAPVAGATVALALVGLNGSLTATTDAAGGFRFADLAEGEYRVWAYESARAARAASVPRLGAGPFAPITLALEPAAVVTGRVIDDASGRGIAASVVFTDDLDVEPRRLTRTDAEGAFSVPGVPFGPWSPEAYAEGYVATESLVFDAERIDTLTLRLYRGGSAEGVVVDAAGLPIEGAQVALVGEDRGGSPVVASEATRDGRAARFAETEGLGISAPGFVPRGELGVFVGPIPFAPPEGTLIGRTELAVAPAPAPAPPIDAKLLSSYRTDAQGRFLVAGLVAGRYVARVVHPSYAPGESASFRAVLGEMAGPVRVTLVRGLVLRGLVHGPAAEPVSGAMVTAEAADGAPLAIAVTGGDGRFELAAIAQHARLQVIAPGYAAAIVDAPVGALGAELASRELDVALERADAALAGRVADHLDRPLSGAAVTLAWAGRGPALRAVTDDEGRFTLGGVGAGRHAVRVEAPGYPPVEATVATGEAVAISVPRGGGVRLDVRDAHTTDPIAAGEVAARGPGGASRAVSVVDGQARLVALAPGTWQLTVSAVGYVPARDRVDVPAGDGPGIITVGGRVIELARGATVAGVVRDAHGERVAGAVVTAGSAHAATDADGRFRLVDVPTGDVELRASFEGARGSTRMSLRPGDEVLTAEISLE